MELYIPLIYLGIVIAFVCIGVFGNLNVIWASIRKKELRGKHGLLLQIFVFMHTVCLVFEFIFTTLNVLYRNIGWSQMDCAKMASIYLFSLCAQVMLALIIVSDLLIAISLPIKHRIWSLRIYIPLITAPAFIYGATFVGLSNTYADSNSTIPACNPMLSMSQSIADLWLLSNFGINVLILVLYAIISIIIHLKAGKVAKKVVTQNACVMRKKTDEQKVLSSLSLLISVFELSWCSFIVCHLILNYSGLKSNIELSGTIRIFLSIFSLICFSQSYYVCRIRSVEYRKTFREQLRILTCRKKKKKEKKQPKKTEKDTDPTTTVVPSRNRTTSFAIAPVESSNGLQMSLPQIIVTS